MQTIEEKIKTQEQNIKYYYSTNRPQQAEEIIKYYVENIRKLYKLQK